MSETWERGEHPAQAEVHEPLTEFDGPIGVTPKRYEVKAWITVEANDEREAMQKAADLLDRLPDDDRASTSLEGEGAVYELEEDDGP